MQYSAQVHDDKSKLPNRRAERRPNLLLAAGCLSGSHSVMSMVVLIAGDLSVDDEVLITNISTNPFAEDIALV